MSVIPQLLPVEINQDKRRIEVLKNTVHMLTNRKLLKSDNLDDNIKKITALNSDDMIYPIILDNPEIYYPKGSNYKILYLKFINQKITGITKTSNIGEFLISKKDFPKIIVVSSISNKTEDQIRHDYPFTEIFMEKNLMIDIVNIFLSQSMNYSLLSKVKLSSKIIIPKKENYLKFIVVTMSSSILMDKSDKLSKLLDLPKFLV
jgi:hypothetical protein